MQMKRVLSAVCQFSLVRVRLHNSATICLFDISITVHVNSKVVYTEIIQCTFDGRVQLVDSNEIHCIHLHCIQTMQLQQKAFTSHTAKGWVHSICFIPEKWVEQSIRILPNSTPRLNTNNQVTSLHNERMCCRAELKTSSSTHTYRVMATNICLRYCSNNVQWHSLYVW